MATRGTSASMGSAVTLASDAKSLGKVVGDYTKSKDLFDQFIARQEKIEERKLNKGEVLKILGNILEDIDNHEDRMERWEAELRDTQFYNDYTRKEGRGGKDIPESEWKPAKPLPTKPEPLSGTVAEVADKLNEFLGRVAHHQSNDSSFAKNPDALVEAFNDLPEVIKPFVLAPRGLIKRLYRGDEAGKSEIVQGRGVASFATTPRNVGFWGRYVYKGSDIQSFAGIIDTGRIVKNFDSYSKIGELLGTIARNSIEIGDDEDEKIVFGIKWKKNVGDRDWMDKNGRKSDTFKEKYYENPRLKENRFDD